MESWWNDLLRSSHEVDKNNEDYSDDFRNLLHGKGNFEVPADHYSEMLNQEFQENSQRDKIMKEMIVDIEEGEEEESANEDEDCRSDIHSQIIEEIELISNGTMNISEKIVDAAIPATEREIIEPSPKPREAALMWEPVVEKRALTTAEHRRGFASVYPGILDPRSAALKMLISTARAKPVLGPRTSDDLARRSMVMQPRAIQEELLRTPLSNERACRHDATCKMLEYFGHIGRECLEPDEMREFERSGILPTNRRSCLGCDRYDATWFWMMARFSGEYLGNVFITGHYVLVNFIGEYRRDQCIASAEYGCPLPVVPFYPGSMVLVKKKIGAEDVTYFTQPGMLPVTEDFP